MKSLHHPVTGHHITVNESAVPLYLQGGWVHDTGEQPGGPVSSTEDASVAGEPSPPSPDYKEETSSFRIPEGLD